MNDSILEIKSLSKSFNVNKIDIPVLDNINLQVTQGDIFGIIGLSGEGKSTLVRCINLLEKPNSGEILYKCEPILKFNKQRLSDYRKKVAMIFQDFNLLSQKTVFENIRFPLELNKHWRKDKTIKDKVFNLIKLVGLEGKEDYYPSQLSGGQQQRVAIARALVNEPDILLCDECTSALDPSTANQILDLLRHLNKTMELTIIIIAHQMSVIERVCNKVAILSGHNIVEQGFLKDIFFNPKTEIGKTLIYGSKLKMKMDNKRGLRLVFNGNINEPIVTLIVETCNVLVDIVMADTKVIDDKVYGQLIIHLPYYEEDIEKVKSFLESKNITYEVIDL